MYYFFTYAPVFTATRIQSGTAAESAGAAIQLKSSQRETSLRCLDTRGLRHGRPDPEMHCLKHSSAQGSDMLSRSDDLSQLFRNSEQPKVPFACETKREVFLQV